MGTDQDQLIDCLVINVILSRLYFLFMATLRIQVSICSLPIYRDLLLFSIADDFILCRYWMNEPWCYEATMRQWRGLALGVRWPATIVSALIKDGMERYLSEKLLSRPIFRKGVHCLLWTREWADERDQDGDAEWSATKGMNYRDEINRCSREADRNAVNSKRWIIHLILPSLSWLGWGRIFLTWSLLVTDYSSCRWANEGEPTHNELDDEPLGLDGVVTSLT